MGKNQAYKAMQRARLGANGAAPDEINDGMVRTLSYHFISFNFPPKLLLLFFLNYLMQFGFLNGIKNCSDIEFDCTFSTWDFLEFLESL